MQKIYRLKNVIEVTGMSRSTYRIIGSNYSLFLSEPFSILLRMLNSLVSLDNACHRGKWVIRIGHQIAIRYKITNYIPIPFS